MKDFVIKNWKIVTIVVLAFLLVLTIGKSRRNQQKYVRERNNVEALMSDLEHERTKRGEDVTTIQELQLTVSEFKKLRAQDAELIKELKLRPPQVKEVVKTVVETKVQVRDSLVYVNPGIFTWDIDTKWWSVNQRLDFNVNPPLNEFSLRTRDSLTTILYKVPKFTILGIRFGTKRYEVKLVNHNPNSEIKYNEWINISRQKTRRKR